MTKGVDIDYTNWKDERRIRRIKPIGIEYDSNKWHFPRQWLLWAADLEDPDGKVKCFAMKNIHSWDVDAGIDPRIPAAEKLAAVVQAHVDDHFWIIDEVRKELRDALDAFRK